jgi:hypothetical protein
MRRALLALPWLALLGCGPVFVLHQPSSFEEMVAGTSLVVVGVIEEHKLEPWPSFRVRVPSRDGSQYWRVLRRRVRVEMVLAGSAKPGPMDIYEVYWTGATSGDWNFTRDGERAVFPLRVEHGYYRVARDWERSIFPVTSGPHSRLPLDESRPLWERIALMNWWIPRTDARTRIQFPSFDYSDPAGKLSQWRMVKLKRGFVRHPSPGVRVPACRDLILLGGWGQDECWDSLSSEDRAHLRDGGYLCCTAAEVAKSRQALEGSEVERLWRRSDRDQRRLITAINHRQMRREFCRLYALEYPGDTDTGCPADQPPPATIVTENGDVPLVGGWPR